MEIITSWFKQNYKRGVFFSCTLFSKTYTIHFQFKKREYLSYRQFLIPERKQKRFLLYFSVAQTKRIKKKTKTKTKTKNEKKLKSSVWK